ncbi:MAG: hybrid sensor histidine kinase/response regulator [Deltaproteobacteria bacterium]|nr:hybrid sensor histidine kinase/response regulator [Deltaproteobacteria bacterium]
MATILVIDDSRVNARILTDILKMEHDVISTTSGRQGFEMAQQVQPSLILLDVDMPEMNGYQVIGLLKSDPATRDIPVIFITAREKEDDETRGLESGAIDYLTKPVSPPIVRARVHNHLELKNQRDYLANLSEMKSKLFTILAHDLKNPFTTLIGMTEMMVEMGDSLTREEMLDLSMRLNDSSKRVFSLLENLLEWLRIQMDNSEPDLGPVNIASAMQRTLSLVGQQAREKELELIVTAPPELNALADENMIDMIFRNLAGNAIKFSRPGGRITLGARQEEPGIRVSVADNGVGMSDNMRGRLFRLGKENTTPGTKGEKGTGLGLVLCQDMARRLGATLEVESEEGKGSVFSLLLQKA